MRPVRSISALAVMAFGCGEPKQLMYSDMTALDDGSVLVLADFYGKHSGILRIGLDGQVVWEAALEGRPTVGYAPLLTHDEVVSVRVRQHGVGEPGIAMEGFNLRTGDRVWRTRFDDLHPDGLERRSRGRTSFIEVVDRPSTTVIALDPSTGIIRARLPIEDPYQMTMIGDRAVFDVMGGAVSLDASGQMASSASVGYGCLVDGGYIHLGRDGGRSMLVAPGGDLAKTERYALDIKIDQSDRIDSCFEYRDQIVFVISSFSQDVTHIVLVDRRGHMTGRVDLRGQPMLTLPRASHAAGTRYMPFMTETRSTNEKRLNMLDLEQRQVAWTRDVDQHKRVFRDRATWYVVDPRWVSNPTIAAFDGDTGSLRAAVRVRADLKEIKREHVGGGSFWLMEDRHWSSQGHVARLDAMTLAVTLPSPALPVEDVREAWLPN